MRLPSVKDLLAELDTMTHAQRCRRLADLARGSDPDLPGLLDQVARTSDYHQVLVLITAGSPQRLLAALDSPSLRVRRAAERRLPLAAADPQALAQHYLQASLVERAVLRARLTGEAGRRVVDEILTHPIGDQARAQLLPDASEPVAARLLDDLADLVPNVRRLARRHPRLVLDHLARRMTGAPRPVRQHWWDWADLAWPELGAHDPQRVLALVAAHPDDRLPPRVLRLLGSLARRYPDQVAALLADPRRPWPAQLPTTLRRGFACFTPEDRLRTARRASTQQLVGLLRALPPSQRGDLFARLTAGQPVTAWPETLLEVLPHQVRQAEARRLLALPEVSDAPARLIQYASYLPYAEALPALNPYLRSRSAQERAQAYAAALRSAGRERQPTTWAAGLELLDRLRNEQDPVRAAAAEALAAAPVSLSATGPQEPLERFSQAVVTARDTSHLTLHSLQHYCWRAIGYLAEHQPDRVSEHLVVLDRLCGPDGTTEVPPLTALPRGAEEPVIAALLPRLVTDAARGEFQLLLALVAALGERAYGQAELQRLLEQAAGSDADWLARRAVELWLQDPARRGERVAQLLSRDESAAVLNSVQQALLSHRQDLLDVLWQPTPLRGRFWRRKACYVPVLRTTATGWLPRQVEAYGAALARLATTRGTPTWQVAAAVRQLGLPGLGVRLLLPFVESADEAQQEAALAALAWSDDPAAAVDRLVAHRGDDRARVAVYALQRCLRFLRPAEAVAGLRTLLSDGSKTTSVKEGARLVGLVRPPQALDLLLELVGPDSHRDVRAALGRTLRGFLDDDRAWQRLAELAAGSRDEGQALAETSPYQLAERHRTRYAQVLLTAARTTPELLGELDDWVPVQPRLVEALTGQVLDPGSGSWLPCVYGLARAVEHQVGWPEVLGLAEQLAARALGPDQPDAADEADLPLLRRLDQLARRLLALSDHDLRPHWHQLAQTLGQYPAFQPWLPAAVVAAVNPADPVPGVLEIPRLAPDPMLCEQLRTAVTRLPSHLLQADPELLGAAADAVLSDDPVAGVVALSLVEVGGSRCGWSEPWRARLRRLRQHRVPAVSGWARQVRAVSTGQH